MPDIFHSKIHADLGGGEMKQTKEKRILLFYKGSPIPASYMVSEIGGSGQQDKPRTSLWAQGRAGGHPSSIPHHAHTSSFLH